jgi:hypothetical protein
MDKTRVLLTALTAMFVLSLVANVMALRRMHQIGVAIDQSRAAAAVTEAQMDRPSIPAAPEAVAPTAASAPPYPAPAEPSATAALPEPPQRDDASIRKILEGIADLRRDVDELRSAPRYDFAASAGWTPGHQDPKVATVLAGQAEFKAFWSDLREVFKARPKLDADDYSRVVMDSTVGFLGFHTDEDRDRFKTATRSALDEIGRIRQEHKNAQAYLPPKENKALYDQQRKLLQDRTQAQLKEARGLVRRELDLKSPRQREFADRLDSWLDELGR